MIKGTTKIKKVVPAIQAALPVLWRSFLETKAASEAACLPRETMGEEAILARMPESGLEADRPRLGCAAMVHYEGDRRLEKRVFI